MSNLPNDGAAAEPLKPKPGLRAVATGASAPDPAADPAQRRGPRRTARPGPQAARAKPRHWAALLSLLLLVALPVGAATAYLQFRAADQFHSDVAFSIRSEEVSSAAAGLIGAITNIGSGSASDANILYEYIRSQAIVEAIDRDIDLRAIFNRAEGDPLFTLGPEASIEDLLAHWNRAVDVAFDPMTGIIHIRATAFTPEDAAAVTTAVLAESSDLVNRLADQAREDAVRFAREELAEAEENLRLQRERLSDFRRQNRLVDPKADVEGQTGLLNALQGDLAEALVERDMLLSFADEGDQRVLQADRRIAAIEGRIEAERSALGTTGAPGALPEVVGRYEELLVDLEFANTAYTQTLAGLAAARAEARRQSRYLAPHVQPTLADRALYPRRWLLSGLAALFLALGWAALMLVYYNVRDNR